MAWPNSRITDFIARQTKIAATFLNALQDWIVAVSTATVSLKAVVVDGTGGAAATGVGGTVKVSRKASGTTLPMAAVGAGEISSGAVIVAWGWMTGAGGILAGYGLAGTAPYKTALGTYNIPTQLNLARFAVLASSNTVGYVTTASGQFNGGLGVIEAVIRTQDLAGADADAPFFFLVLGET